MPTWNNIPGVFSVEVCSLMLVGCGPWAFDIGSNRLPMIENFVQPGKDLELIIEFKSSGCYTPASMYGGSDRTGWPEERSEDRELVRAYLLDWKTEIALPVEVQQQLFQFYLREIYAVELVWEPEEQRDE